jgi:NTE family protein
VAQPRRTERLDYSIDNNNDRSVLLALSGGGYRAMLFHVGALWKLNEIGELGRLAHVSSVSGGSIAAGVLAMNWRLLEFAEGVATNFRDRIADPLMRLAEWTLDVPAGIWGLIPFCSAGNTLEYLYKRLLFGKTTLADLPESPRFTFTATNLQTGALWIFDRDTMGDETLGELPATSVPLARAVAASSAFPPFLAPLVLRPKRITWRPSSHKFSELRSYDNLAIRVAEVPQGDIETFRRRVVLVDGGVADNLGVLPVWRSEGDLYVSDGGGGSRPQRRPWQNWLSQLIRIVSLVHEQPSQLRANRSKAEMADRDQGGAKSRSPRAKGDGAVWNMHWPPEDHDHDPDFPSRQKADWAHLAGTRTRLKAMSPALQMQLINWGYIACNRSLPYINRLFFLGLYASAFKEDSLPFPEARMR